MEISSRNVVEGTARSPHRAMYKAMGLNDDDLSKQFIGVCHTCLLYTSPSPRDGLLSRMPSSA